MRGQRFVESDWDYCFVLDACRFDVFRDVYDEYVDGNLEKRRSRGSSTPEWAHRTLRGNLDMAYFSANPFINSLEIPLCELRWGASCEYEWTATDHLGTVIDVWREGWDEDCGTVPPENVADSFYRHQDVVERHDRTVLHYMQPHAPYIGSGNGKKLATIRDGIKRQGEQNGAGGSSLTGSLVSERVRPMIESTLGNSSLAMKAGLLLELEKPEALSNGTRETALQCHEENLRLALECVVDILPELDGTVVITADHGEAMGEQGVWEHQIETHIPPLIEVPWLEVTG